MTTAFNTSRTKTKNCTVNQRTVLNHKDSVSSNDLAATI